ncbi:Hypothetical protein, predicted lipoprotein, DUF285 family [Mycoplasma yeatsii 13926]|uniref:PARCEL domain-containing protein n=1 Tax=Mycoplasma yeatsii 13926 TaxID=1188240 RepID=S6G409_9MOLU|nr:BspA family leucine-rich repeat surface protein [Mycoplasma yeatsii]EOA07442.1 Hypothetical protein, predicted lipoprotein, DUF285 family [Mycoplasma yeatsii 13926]
MNLGKKAISLISSISLIGSCIGIGLWVWYGQYNKIESIDLKKLIVNKNLGYIYESEKTKEKLIQLIDEKNPNINLDFNMLDLQILDNSAIVKPMDKTYKNEVEITFKMSQDLSSVIRERNLGYIYESEKTKEKLIKLIKQKNSKLDVNKVVLTINDQENKAMIKPKTGDKTYKGQVNFTFHLSQDLSSIITETNLGNIEESEKNQQDLLNLIKQSNPSLDTEKVQLDIKNDIVIVLPKMGDKTYKGEAIIRFFAHTWNADIKKIKTIWNTEFKDRFSMDVNEIHSTALFGLLVNTLYKHGLKIPIATNGLKGQGFSIEYGDIELKLPIGFKYANNLNKYNNDKTKLLEIGHYISKDFTFKAEQVDGNVKEVPDVLPEIINNTSYMFANNKNEYIKGLENWNTSNVTNMKYMFYGAHNFNQPLNNWNTSNVTDMKYMFYESHNFNQPLNNWNTSNVTDMGWMFSGAKSFNQPIDKWNTSNVTNMGHMFSRAKNFNQPLSNWNTSNVTDMSYMFSGDEKFNHPLNNWNTSNVTNMHGMFIGAKNFNKPLNNWDTSNVTDMSAMFSGAEKFNNVVSTWNTSNVTDMSWMFYGARACDQNIANWNVYKVTYYSWFAKNSGWQNMSWRQIYHLWPKKLYDNGNQCF